MRRNVALRSLFTPFDEPLLHSGFCFPKRATKKTKEGGGGHVADGAIATGATGVGEREKLVRGGWGGVRGGDLG